MRQGSISGELSRAEATPERILALAMPMEGMPKDTTASGTSGNGTSS
jgi:hypothetical protein